MLYVTPQVARASALLDGGRLTRFDVDLVGVDQKEATLDAPPGRTAISAARSCISAPIPTTPSTPRCTIDNARIGPGWQPPLGSDLSLFLASGKLTQAQALMPLRHGKDSFFAAAERWRLAKGTLSLTEFEFRWGGVSATATGRMTFDELHR